MKSLKNLMKCADCGCETVQEYFMLKDDLWKEVTELPKKKTERWPYKAPEASKAPTQDEIFLCIGCVEQRLGRMLNYTDFSDAPINNLNFPTERSKRLWNRLTTMP